MATSFPGKDPGYEVDKMAASGPLRNRGKRLFRWPQSDKT